MKTLHSEAQISVASNSQSPFELIKKTNSTGQEIWSARDLQKVLEYSRWEKFEKAILSVKEEFEFENLNLSQNFCFTDRGTNNPKRKDQILVDYELSRFFCYKLAMRGETDACKKSRTYFAVQTRKQELAPAPQTPTFDIREVARQLLVELDDKILVIQEKDRQIEIMQPKVQFIDDTFCEGQTGLTPMKTVAQEIGIGAVKLYKLLRDKKVWQHPLNEYGVPENLPMQTQINNGNFVVKQFWSDRQGKSFDKIFATNKGKLLCYKIVKKDKEQQNTSKFEIILT